MPLFEYHCRSCGNQFEWLHMKAGDDPSRCPRCGKGAPVRQLSVFAVPTSRAVPAGPCGSHDCACRRAPEN